MTPVEIAMCLLCDTDRDLISAYYYDGHTHAEIGSRIGYSREHAGKMVRRALTRLKRIVAELCG